MRSCALSFFKTGGCVIHQSYCHIWVAGVSIRYEISDDYVRLPLLLTWDLCRFS